MDLLGHVNNVAYVDYLQEARIDMLGIHDRLSASRVMTEGVVVVRHEVTFVAPLVYRPEPVLIECWVSEIKAATFTIAYEMYDELPDGDRRVYLRASTVLAPFVFAQQRPGRLSAEQRRGLADFADTAPTRSAPIPPLPPSGPRHVSPLQVRFSDVDAYGHVNNVLYVEFFQEARIVYLNSLAEADTGPWRGWVIAQTDLDYLRPMLFRAQPYHVRSWVTRVGTTSMSIAAEIVDTGPDHLDPATSGLVVARAQVVLVAFDPSNGRPREFAPTQRAALQREVSAT